VCAYFTLALPLGSCFGKKKHPKWQLVFLKVDRRPGGSHLFKQIKRKGIREKRPLLILQELA
jgi:hypothetical protein